MSRGPIVMLPLSSSSSATVIGLSLIDLEIQDSPPLALVKHLEIPTRQRRDHPPMAVVDDGVDGHEVNRRLERRKRLVRLRTGGRLGTCHEDNG